MYKRFKCLISDEEGSVYDTSGIDYEGKLWLAPTWLGYENEGWRMPERLVRFDHLPHSSGPFGADYLVEHPIPKSDLFGEPQSGPDVLMNPTHIRIDVRDTPEL